MSKVTRQQKPQACVRVGRPEDEEPDGEPGLKQFSGSKNRPFSNVLLNNLLFTLWSPANLPDDEKEKQRIAALFAMKAFKPSDELEGMLAAQAVAMHAASMECFRRAMIPEQSSDVAARLRKDGASLARGMADMLDALDRKRGKGPRQVVRVERVMVAPGGQAIVGNLAAGTPGGGANGKINKEPHAPPAGLAHDAAPGAIRPALRSEDTERLPVPSARNGERALPDARRT